jgi:hypothetical protein
VFRSGDRATDTHEFPNLPLWYLLPFETYRSMEFRHGPFAESERKAFRSLLSFLGARRFVRKQHY